VITAAVVSEPARRAGRAGQRRVAVVDGSGCLVRVAPVLVFLVGATVIAELTDAAGVFDVLTRRAAEVIDELTYSAWYVAPVNAGSDSARTFVRDARSVRAPA
jgi:hypothetical protein